MSPPLIPSARNSTSSASSLRPQRLRTRTSTRIWPITAGESPHSKEYSTHGRGAGVGHRVGVGTGTQGVGFAGASPRHGTTYSVLPVRGEATAVGVASTAGAPPRSSNGSGARAGARLSAGSRRGAGRGFSCMTRTSVTSSASAVSAKVSDHVARPR